MNDQITLYPNCKINAGLDILSRRDDGFHEIETLMLPIYGICDRLTIERDLTAESIRFDATGIKVDCGKERNLVVRAWILMRERYGIGGVRIALHKEIPYGAGLGGGSADAAFTITGLNELFELGLTTTELESVAAELGSDTSFFVSNRPAFCQGRGEILTPFDIDLKGLWAVVTKPQFEISTPEAYAQVTPHIPATPLRRRLSLPVEQWQGVVTNDFEEPLLRSHLPLRNIKNGLLKQGAVYASLSGSGSALFGLFDREPNYKPTLKGETFFEVKF
ncbi:MAG: 4-(cytidine 5'-diphospho)-2-C-methyl-D-erythritol kinase [Tidjanibacter sp.]|nr:4-(cytidine 5'-diphospho)-2-C-methyl-D-erythritol kinase [Tidjanibacter sp.]